MLPMLNLYFGNDLRESGGNAIANSSGEGGFSYVSPLAIERLTDVEQGQHLGSGTVDILPAIAEGCGCDHLCVVLDPSLVEKQCVCPDGWQPEENATKCSGKSSRPTLSLPNLT